MTGTMNVYTGTVSLSNLAGARFLPNGKSVKGRKAVLMRAGWTDSLRVRVRESRVSVADSTNEASHAGSM